MRKWQLQDKLQETEAQYRALKLHYEGVDALLDDLKLLFPEIVRGEFVREAWINGKYTVYGVQKLVDTFLASDIHLVAENLREKSVATEKAEALRTARRNLGISSKK